MTLKIDFGESDFAPEETPKAAGGTELMQKWLFSRIDPELKNYFQWVASRKRKLEDGTKIDSIANRMLIFDGAEKHCSTTTTNVPVRINININYIQEQFHEQI